MPVLLQLMPCGCLLISVSFYKTKKETNYIVTETNPKSNSFFPIEKK